MGVVYSFAIHNVQCYFYSDFEYCEYRAIPDPYTEGAKGGGGGSDHVS